MSQHPYTPETIPTVVETGKGVQPRPISPLRFISETFTGLTLVGAVMVVIVVTLAVGAPALALHDPVKQDLSVRLLPPAFLAGGCWWQRRPKRPGTAALQPCGGPPGSPPAPLGVGCANWPRRRP